MCNWIKSWINDGEKRNENLGIKKNFQDITILLTLKTCFASGTNLKKTCFSFIFKDANQTLESEYLLIIWISQQKKLPHRFQNYYLNTGENFCQKRMGAMSKNWNETWIEIRGSTCPKLRVYRPCKYKLCNQQTKILQKNRYFSNISLNYLK